MNKQQKQNLTSLYGHVNKRIAIIAPDGFLSFRETPDAYLMEQLVEILKFELAKNESLEASILELVANLQTQQREYLSQETKMKAAQKNAELSLKGLRTAVIALAAASELDVNFRSSYQSVSDCIESMQAEGTKAND